MGLFLLGLAQFDLSVFGATFFAATQLGTGLQQQIAGLAALVTDVEHLTGIVGIVAVGGAQFGSTLASLLTFSVLINLNLAVTNLLPLPPVDGGRILFCVLEKIYRPVARAEAPLTLAGWMMVLALMTYATVQDVGRIFA